MRQALRETNTRDTYLGVEMRLIHETNTDGSEAWHVRTNSGVVLGSARSALDAFALSRKILEGQASSLLSVRYN